MLKECRNQQSPVILRDEVVEYSLIRISISCGEMFPAFSTAIAGYVAG